MKIAINCIYYSEKAGGIKEYIFNLIVNITKVDRNNEYVIYVTKEYFNEINSIVGENFKVKIFPLNSSDKIKRALFQGNFWKKEEKEEAFDIFHSPFFYSPRFRNAKIVITVHDLRFLKYPRTYTFKRLVFLKHAVSQSIRIRSDKIIAISNFTKQEICNNYKVDNNRINVIYEAVDEKGFELETDNPHIDINGNNLVENSFLLAVGHLEPRKNYMNLIDAYNSLDIFLQKKYKLVIVGKKNHDYEKVLNEINNSKNVIYLNFITRKELVWLYAKCKVHIFPSYYEGFGFPSLEAGLFGKPSIASNQTSIPEITGKGGVYFDPFNINDISKKIDMVLKDEMLYQDLCSNAVENIKRFSWKENALQTIDVYKSMKI